jgi:hypothetical protein
MAIAAYTQFGICANIAPVPRVLMNGQGNDVLNQKAFRFSSSCKTWNRLGDMRFGLNGAMGMTRGSIRSHPFGTCANVMNVSPTNPRANNSSDRIHFCNLFSFLIFASIGER